MAEKNVEAFLALDTPGTKVIVGDGPARVALQAKYPHAHFLGILQGEVLAPLSIVAFILGRELTIWFGAWVAARGKRVTELNNEAQREYERTLEAGPRLHQS